MLTGAALASIHVTNPSPAADTRTALELVAECVARLRMTDPADTAAVLLAGWHGFGTAQAAGTLLAQNSFDDAALARNTWPVFAAVIKRFQAAPSLPYTDPVVETVTGLVPDGFRPDQAHIPVDDPHAEPDTSPAGAVRRGILALAFELNALLPQAAEHATDPADTDACHHGTRLAHELAVCWQGHLGSYLNATGRDR